MLVKLMTEVPTIRMFGYDEIYNCTRTIFLQNNSLLSYAYIELDFLLHFIERENRIVFM